LIAGLGDELLESGDGGGQVAAASCTSVQRVVAKWVCRNALEGMEKATAIRWACDSNSALNGRELGSFGGGIPARTGP
jgi:hypothetical protein